jgi:hypothetical protein
MRLSMVFAAGVFLMCGCAAVFTAKAVTVAPIVDGSVRDMDIYGIKDGTADSVIDGGAIDVLNVPSMESRGIVEFSLSCLSGQITSTAQLVLPVFDSGGPFPYGINVYSYAGDGNPTLSDWSAGFLLTSFTYSGAETVTLDATSFISSALTQGYLYAGFNFRFADASSIEDNGPYLSFGSIDCTPATSLQITTVPEANTLTLMLLGIFSLVLYAGWLHLHRRSAKAICSSVDRFCFTVLNSQVHDGAATITMLPGPSWRVLVARAVLGVDLAYIGRK